MKHSFPEPCEILMKLEPQLQFGRVSSFFKKGTRLVSASSLIFSVEHVYFM